MIYRFLILSDEVDNFSREIEIDSESTFLDFNNAILESVDYNKEQLTSFFHCMNGWEKYEEITLIEMDTNAETDSYVMDSTRLYEFAEDEGDRLIFVFDNLTERSFFIELKEVKSGSLQAPVCTRKKGTAPKQITSEDEFLYGLGVEGKDKNKILDDDDFYGDSEFDMDELDSEGFGDVGLDEISDAY